MAELPEPPDLTRIEFEFGTDVYAAWRNDEEGRKAGWSVGDGQRNWVLYPGSVPWTWRQLIADFSEESLRLAVRLIVHPDDVHLHTQWPTQRTP